MFNERRQRFLDQMGPDAVAIFIGARLVTRSNDTEFPFRQDSDFWYLTGFDHPDAIAVLRTDGGPPFTLFVQPREPEAETWTGYRPGVEGATGEYGADEAHPRADFETKVSEIVTGAERLFHVLGRDTAIDAKLVATLEDLRRRSRVGVIGASAISDPRQLLHEMRLIKQPEEVALLRRAAAITHEAHAEAAKLAQPGRYEYELEAVLDYTFRRRGSSGPAYATIVGGGRNATVLHYIRNSDELRDGDLVLIDAGAELAGYAADVTRTYPVGGRFVGAKRDVYEAVLTAQEVALERCVPGATLDEIHDATLASLVDSMRSLKLVQGSRDEVIEQGSFRAYYMHRTSHWIGLDVHDAGAYTEAPHSGGGPDKALTPRALSAGMVFSVEPGLYISQDAETAPEALRGIGVRIEDDILITEDGAENLDAAIPKTIDDVEALVRA